MTLFLLIFVASFSFYLGQNLPYWIGRIVTKIQNERILRKIRPTEVDENRLCNQPHEWFSAPHTVDEKGDYTYVNVCKNCGIIPTMNSMASIDGLKHIKKNQKLLKEEEQIKDGFSKFEEDEIRFHFEEELKNGLEFGKLVKVYRAGQTMKERFILYRLYNLQNSTTENQDERGN